MHASRRVVPRIGASFIRTIAPGGNYVHCCLMAPRTSDDGGEGDPDLRILLLFLLAWCLAVIALGAAFVLLS